MDQHEQTPTERAKSSQLWDCGSTLYDSFELRSFKRVLDSAIVTRALSMPHRPGRLPEPLDPPPPQLPLPPPKKGSKISRSLHKLLRSVFKPGKPFFGVKPHEAHKGNFIFFYDKSGALSTIPEVPESECFAALSPEVGSFVRKTASERFTVAPVGISYA
ncbi:uncharacterized protein LOC115754703 [Rhodamnia argentea]|uniref:Uncharacterized protein LOC115754703 n=1 Tax=Rhodamnia argentea TaxID=178133 RepID=A0A8B8QRN5_9MYRT|nr:uncharacterized protein LOC115754703 [Rhodamnia argentea]